MQTEVALVLGGVRSGKSNYARRLAIRWARSSGRPVAFLATGVDTDEEMCARIARHRQERPRDWTTVEAPEVPSQAVAALDRPHVLLLDDVGCLVTNHLLAAGDGGADRAAVGVGAELDRLLAATGAGGHALVMVSNEVGMGVVPPYPLGRQFRDLLGMVNQHLAGRADTVVLMVAGCPLSLGPAVAP